MARLLSDEEAVVRGAAVQVLGRMGEASHPNGNAPGSADEDPGAAKAKGEAVNPKLLHLCKWLTTIGTPPLRCEQRFALAFSTSILTQKPTFTQYVESKTVGSPHRPS